MDTPKLDAILHHPNRLAIMSYLMASQGATFTQIKQATDLTDGNLGSHLKKLEENGYIQIKKTATQTKPLARASLTAAGEQALFDYLKQLKSLIKNLDL